VLNLLCVAEHDNGWLTMQSLVSIFQVRRRLLMGPPLLHLLPRGSIHQLLPGCCRSSGSRCLMGIWRA
jgi:hypothetical protein